MESRTEAGIKGSVEMNFEEASKTPKEIARLFGDTAKQLKEGQKLIVKMASVEGRTIAILESE